VGNGIGPYGVASHRHLPEIELGLAKAAGAGAAEPVVTFTPHLMSMSRGILETMYVRGAAGRRGRGRHARLPVRGEQFVLCCQRAPRRRKPCY
jgi:N-acetyl-gamma-glutamyl-phosphate reductase